MKLWQIALTIVVLLLLRKPGAIKESSFKGVVVRQWGEFCTIRLDDGTILNSKANNNCVLQEEVLVTLRKGEVIAIYLMPDER